jgi:hypothetical protein
VPGGTLADTRMMKRILYNGGVVDTGTEIANAVLAYAEELAKHGTSDTVDIPMVQVGGQLGRAQLLLGPASQFVIEEVSSTAEEPVDDEAVRDMTRKRSELESPRPVGRGGTEFPEIDENIVPPDPELAP